MHRPWGPDRERARRTKGDADAPSWARRWATGYTHPLSHPRFYSLRDTASVATSTALKLLLNPAWTLNCITRELWETQIQLSMTDEIWSHHIIPPIILSPQSLVFVSLTLSTVYPPLLSNGSPHLFNSLKDLWGKMFTNPPMSNLLKLKLNEVTLSCMHLYMSI